MKTIILFRHGKSDWSAEDTIDHDRSLAPRGIKASKMMGEYLSNENSVPDLVISSTAVRARTTAENAMEFGEWGCPIELERGIYGGPPQFLLELINKQDDQYVSICLVGHEPNFSSFIALATNTHYQRFPTASMARIDFTLDRWSYISMGSGTLKWLIRPKELSN